MLVTRAKVADKAHANREPTPFVSTPHAAQESRHEGKSVCEREDDECMYAVPRKKYNTQVEIMRQEPPTEQDRESRIPEIVPIFLDPVDHDAVHRAREGVFLFLLLTVRRRIDEAVFAECRGRA